jgi:hypothetical protein
MTTVVETLVQVGENIRGVAKSLGHPDYQHVTIPDLGNCQLSKKVPVNELKALYSTRNVTITGSFLWLVCSPEFEITPVINVDGTDYNVLSSRRESATTVAILSPLIRSTGPSLFA